MGVTYHGALVLLVVLASACATPQSNFDYSTEPDPRQQEYVLGPSDVVHVSVWRNTELSGDATVRPDGTISLPLLGDLRAAGQTPSKLRADITKRLATFLKEEAAIVTVSVSAINSYRFVVNGNVEHPGVFSSSHYVTVVEAIAMAGGPNRFGSPELAVIIRSGAGGKARRIPINYPAILTGVHPEQDLTVLPADTIYIP